MIGHGTCYIIIETSFWLDEFSIEKLVKDRVKVDKVVINQVQQDPILAHNQETLHCGDNGIFKGVPISLEERELAYKVRLGYEKCPYDGKYILDDNFLIACQSNANELPFEFLGNYKFNPLGNWTGGIEVDSGATNRKLGSDMGRAATGGGLCLSGDTEYIGTDYKWHKIKDYKTGDKVGQWNNGILEFVVPDRYIHNKNDEFILFENDTKLSMELTPNHDILLRTSKGNLIKHKAWEVANSIESKKGNLGKILHSFVYKHNEKPSIYPNENMFRLQVAFCADGTLLGGCNKTWRGRIRVKKQYKKERLRELLNGTSYKETQDGDYSIFWFKPTLECKSLYECFKNENWEILYDEIYRWDGDSKRLLFRTMIKENADFIQFVIASLGKVSTITQAKGCYSVHELKSVTTGVKESKGCFINVTRLTERKDSYCFNVPSHNLIVRHNDRIFITGNCGKDFSKADVSVNIWAHLQAQKLGYPIECVCAIGDTNVCVIEPSGERYFVPFATCVNVAKEYIAKLGGFEKFAEWGLIR